MQALDLYVNENLENLKHSSKLAGLTPPLIQGSQEKLLAQIMYEALRRQKRRYSNGRLILLVFHSSYKDHTIEIQVK